MWASHEFNAADLEFWAGEIAAAAIEIPDVERGPFLLIACAGSQQLLDRTRALVANAWGPPLTPSFIGSCRAGDIVRDCIILRPVGRGGMGEVYRGIQRSVRRLVAVKVVTQGANRASLEAANAARLLHPNIVAVYDADPLGDRPSIVLEFVEGVSLRTWLEGHWQKRQGPPPLAQMRAIVRQIALALTEAHRHGLVHLDVKPENILLTKRDGNYAIKVADFGIARRVETPSGETMGTAGYMAPEQVNAKRPDARADLFALGVILYEMLTGNQPFAGRSAAETYFNTLSLEPVFPDEHSLAPVVAVARKALQKAPEQRYQTAQELIGDLDDQTDDAENDHNPLLSELPVAVQRWWAWRRSGAVLAFVSFVWGAATLGLSAALGAACVRVLWASTGPGRDSYEMLFGYAIEPNAGLWYLVGTSLVLLVGCGLLDAAHRGLVRTRTLKTVGGRDERPLARVAATNLAVFRYATPVLALVALGFVAIPELAYRGDHAFGWVQADLAGSHVGAMYERLKRDRQIGELAPVESLCHACEVEVAAVSNARSGFEAPPPLGFGVFLALALGHQVAFAAFLLWICAKILFFFWILSTALLGGAKHRLRLTPDFQDTDDYRFGLGRMDNVYYAILWLVVVGSVGLSLQTVANVTKGTYFFAGDPAPALFGQAVSLLAILALLLVVLLTPVCVFLFLSIKGVDQELARLSGVRRSLEASLESARSAEDRDRIRAALNDVFARRLTAKKQSLLPIRQPMFVALLSVSVLMLLVLPLSIQWSRRSGNGASGGRPFSNAVCAMTGNPQSLR